MKEMPTFSDYLSERSKSKQKRKRMKRKQKAKAKKKEFNFIAKMKKERKVKRKIGNVDEKLINEFLEAEALEFDGIDTVNEWGDSINIEMEDGSEYIIYPSYDDAYDAALEQVKDFIDMEGFEFINGWEDYLDEDRLGEDFARDEYDMAYDEPESYLDEDPEDDGEWSDDQRERAGEIAKERIMDDPVGYVKDIYGSGSDAFKKAVENYVDEDALAEYVVDTDGPANTLARYDGDEISLRSGGVAYRVN